MLVTQCVRILCLLLISASTPAWAVDIEHLSVVRKGRAFATHAVFFVDVPRETLVRSASDFERMAHINPAVLSTAVQMRPSGDRRVTTTLRDCVSAVCRTVVLVEDVRTAASGELSSRVVPGAGDFSWGRASWRFDDHAGGTRVHYRGEIKPSFWVPRLIGSGAFKRSLKRQVTATALRLEMLGDAGLDLVRRGEARSPTEG